MLDTAMRPGCIVQALQVMTEAAWSSWLQLAARAAGMGGFCHRGYRWARAAVRHLITMFFHICHTLRSAYERPAFLDLTTLRLFPRNDPA
jgi:hypothetical protein